MFVPNSWRLTKSIFFFFFLLLPLLLRLPWLTNGANPEYSACSTLYSCGRVKNIGYPFWGGDRPNFCGIPTLKLNCRPDAELPTIIVYNNGGLGFNVHGINQSSHTILVSRDRVLERCYVQDTTLVTLIPNLKPNPNYSEITLFYGCDDSDNRCKSAIETRSKSFRCTNTDNTNGYAYYFHGGRSSPCSCTNNASAPVSATQVEQLNGRAGGGRNVSLWDVLAKLPVELVYTANFTECSKCEESGGRCGSSQDEFVYHCSNGAQPLTCSQSTSVVARSKLDQKMASKMTAAAIKAIAVKSMVEEIKESIPEPPQDPKHKKKISTSRVPRPKRVRENNPFVEGQKDIKKKQKMVEPQLPLSEEGPFTKNADVEAALVAAGKVIRPSLTVEPAGGDRPFCSLTQKERNHLLQGF